MKTQRRDPGFSVAEVIYSLLPGIMVAANFQGWLVLTQQIPVAVQGG